jgi:tRNA(Ile)-lysidine synthase TilS/MesJ
MFEQSYPLLQKLPVGIYNNKDASPLDKKIFVNLDDDNNLYLKTIHELKNTRLHNVLYQNAAVFPLQRTYDFTYGTGFRKCYLPSEDYSFHVTNDSIEVKTISSPNLSITEYTNYYYDLIEQKLLEIYSNNDHVVLSYSGGIDSLTLLSFVIKLNLLSKTTIVYYENSIQSSEYEEMPLNNKEKSNAIQHMLDRLSEKAKNVIKLSITQKDFVDVFNNHSFIYCNFYTTTTALKLFQNAAFISGHMGNQALIHKDIFLDQILLASDEQSKETIKQRLQKADFYTINLKNYNVNKTLIPLKYSTLCIKNSEHLSGLNGNRVYMPLATDLKMARNIDFSKVDVDAVLNATVARDIINRNVGKDFDNYIITECVVDADVVVDRSYDINLFNNSALTLPLNLKHCPLSYGKMLDTLNSPMISHSKLLSLKAMQWLSAIYHS